MSERTPCNYCTLKRIRKIAEEENQKVTLIPMHGGTEVFVSPKDSPVHAEHFACWLQEITDHCVC